MVVIGNFRNHAELRKKPRRHFHYNARILIDEKGTTVQCSISDISETGARVTLESDCPLPERFMLLLTQTGAARRRCRVVWRTGATIGIEFPDANS
jgi:hypothetical protein